MKKRACLKNVLKIYRQRAGLSQLDVANSLNYTSAQFISNWERGLSSPPDGSLDFLCDILCIPKATMMKAILDDRRTELENIL